jgi:hypothetical protein
MSFVMWKGRFASDPEPRKASSVPDCKLLCQRCFLLWWVCLLVDGNRWGGEMLVEITPVVTERFRFDHNPGQAPQLARVTPLCPGFGSWSAKNAKNAKDIRGLRCTFHSPSE